MQIVGSEVRCIWLIVASHCSHLCTTKQKANVGLVVWVSHNPHHWHFQSLNGIGTSTLDLGSCWSSVFIFVPWEGLHSTARH